MIRIEAWALLVIVIASLVYYRSLAFIPFVLGACCGVGVNVVKIVWLEHTVQRGMTMSGTEAIRYVRTQMFLRHLLTAAVLLLSAFVPFIDLLGTAAGILTWQVATWGLKP